MMITQHDNNGELSYFKSALLFYLKESHPHMAGNKVLIQKRANSAAEDHALRSYVIPLIAFSDYNQRSE